MEMTAAQLNGLKCNGNFLRPSRCISLGHANLRAVSNFVRHLPRMRQPLALRPFHVCKYGAERGILRAAGVQAKADGPFRFMQMTDAHLPENDAVIRTLDAEIIRSAAEAVPHGFDVGGNLRGGPVRVTVIGHNAAKMLKTLIFILDGAFQPFSLSRYTTTPH